MMNPFKSMNEAMQRRQKKAELAYLNGATDMIDLEYRERELDRRSRRMPVAGTFML